MEFNVAGEVFDGDPGRLTRTCAYAQELCINILQRPDLSLAELAKIAIHVNHGTYIYEYPLHLVKVIDIAKSVELKFVHHFMLQIIQFQKIRMRKVAYLVGF